MGDARVRGLKELHDVLQSVPVAMEKSILRASLRKGMNVVKPLAQRGVHSISGKLAKGLKVGTKVQNGRIIAYLKARGVHAFVAHLLEMTGAKPHQITPKHAKALGWGDRVYASVRHRGFKRKPFMRPPLDQMAGQIVVAAAEEMKVRLATKAGIDTSYIDVGEV